jgi:regulator of protease activity HflC (stomatin/prohibitin superfamily)
VAKDEVITLLVFYLVLLAVLATFAAKSVVFTKPHERLALFRLGKFVGVRSPGINIVIPFLDRVVKVRVEQIRGHELMSEQQLLEKIEEIYRFG